MGKRHQDQRTVTGRYLDNVCLLVLMTLSINSSHVYDTPQEQPEEGLVQFRLTGGKNCTEGRVEVLIDNIWGTVCDDSWDANDGKVLCRQLGFPHESPVAIGNAHFGEGSGPIWMNDVRCTGFEISLHDCLYRGLGVSHCEHDHDAGVICTDRPTVQFRLTGGSNSTEGRVEVRIGNVWGTVCDDMWDANDATVLCRQLGFPFGSPVAIVSAYFGKGSGPMWMGDVRCSGSEITLQDCQHRGWRVGDCGHNKDAGVICTARPAPIRLVGGSSSNEGRVEIRIDNIWGTVCDDTWEANDAMVLCRQLGLPRGSPVALEQAYFGEGTGMIWMDGVKCSGSEISLQHCEHGIRGNIFCRHGQDAGVICTEHGPTQFRLAGGGNSTEGRVELLIDNVWGTVCSDLWDTNDAKVICRQFGFPHSYPVPLRNAYFGEGSGPIWMDNVGCTGHETSLEMCNHIGWGVNNCVGHERDAGVVCTDDESAMTMFSNSVVLNLAGVPIELCLYDFLPYNHDNGELSHSCQDRCDKVYLHQTYHCKCDVLCEAHGDCCIDYAIFCLLQPDVNQAKTHDQRSRGISTTINSHAYQEKVISWGWLTPFGRCIYPTEYSDFIYFIVNRCPDDSIAYLKEACENVALNDPISFIPVSVDNVDFQNRFCAMCWGYDQTSFEVWDIEFDTCMPDFLFKSPMEVLRYTLTNCTNPSLNYRNNGKEASSPRCSYNMIQTCPDGTNSSLAEACTSYMATIRVGSKYSSVYYKNPHCAVCNMADMENNLGCVPKTTPDPFGEKSTPALFQFSMSTESLTGPRGQYAISKVDCAAHTLYDPYNDVCREITCPGNSRFNGKTCVTVYDQSGRLDYDTYVRLEFQVYSNVNTTTKDVKDVVTDQIRRNIMLQLDDIQITSVNLEASPSPSLSIVDNSLHEDVTMITLTSAGYLLDVFFEDIIQQLSDDILNHCIGDDRTVAVVTVMTLSNFQNITMLEQNCSGNHQQLTSHWTSKTPITDTAVVNLTTDKWFLRLSSNSVPQIITVYSNYSHTRKAFLCMANLSCTYITLKSEEYEWIDGKQNTLLHIASERQIPSEEVIVLQDNTVQICSFFHELPMNYFQYSDWQIIVNILGSLMSIVALFVTILTYSIFAELRNIPGKTILSLSVTMIFGQFLLLFATDFTSIYPVCLSVALLMQFAWTAAFTWTSILAYDLALTFGSTLTMRDMNSSSTFKKYSIYAWGLPLAAVCVTATIHFVVPFNDSTQALYDLVTICWLKAGIPLLVAFGVPVGLLLLANIVFFVYTIIGIRRTRRATAFLEKDGHSVKKIKEDVCRACKLSFVISLTWIIGFIIPYTGVPALWYVFLVLNSLQGPVIMWSFVCNNRVSVMWKERIRRALGMPENVKGSHSTTRSKSPSSPQDTSIQMQTTGV